MSSLPLIAVSQRVDRIEGRDETRDALDQRIAQWLIGVGALAVPVPNVLGTGPGIGAWLEALSPHAIVLTGGNDVGGCPPRDATETALIEFASHRHLPLLGICRGMQMLAHHAGSLLVRVTGHVRTRHALLGDEAAAGRFPSEVNSFHDWGLTTCPPGYRCLAKAPDGTIEAIRHEHRPWEGWMWHPEREAGFNPLDGQRAHRLLIQGHTP